MKEQIKAFLKKITFAKWTALLVAAVTVFTLQIYFGSDPFWMVERIGETKEELATAEEELAVLEKDKAEKQAEYEELNKEYQDKVHLLENAAEAAAKTLDKMCSEDKFHSYSRYYDCYDNDFQCKSLHEAEEKAEEELSDYKKETGEKVEALKNQAESLENQVNLAKSNVESLKEELKELKSFIKKAVFTCIATLLAAAGLGAFAAYLFLEKSFKILGLAGCGAVILGSGISFFLLDELFLMNPYLYGAVLFAMFGIIIAKDCKGKLIPYRVVAVIAALLVFVLTSVLGSADVILLGLYFVVAMILAAFVLVPLDFKEYVKIAKHIFLSVITCGIWLFVWIFHVTKNLNKVQSLEERKPVNELLLCLFLPFYFVYWLYKNAEYVEFYGAEKGVTVNKISILCFIIGFFCPLLSTILMQDKINQIVGKNLPEEAPEEPAAE